MLNLELNPTQKHIIYVVALITFPILITINGFFIVRFISEVDKIKEIVWQLRQDVVVLQSRIDVLREGVMKK